MYLDKIVKTVKTNAKTVEIEERGVKLRLTVVDTPGFGDAVNNENSFAPLVQYIDTQFEKYFHSERGLNRRNISDTRVHCCFYFISPFGHGLKPLDIECMKQLHQKVNIVPVIAKSDVLTKQEITTLKKRILEEVKAHGIKVYTLPEVDEDEDQDYKEEVRQLKAAMPFAVSGSASCIEVKGKKVRGRLYPWGVVEIENPEHSDFVKLRTMLITHMQDLQEVTQEVHYENYRLQKLAQEARAGVKAELIMGADQKDGGIGGGVGVGGVQDKDQMKRILEEKEAELRKMQEIMAKMQAEIKQQKV